MAQYLKTVQIICGICELFSYSIIQQWFHQKTIIIILL